MANPAKHCAICNRAFVPDARVAKRQYVCSSLACQRERKRRTQKKWTKMNPGYFKGRYHYVKSWLQAHPNYLNEYRRRRKNSSPEYKTN